MLVPAIAEVTSLLLKLVRTVTFYTFIQSISRKVVYDEMQSGGRRGAAAHGTSRRPSYWGCKGAAGACLQKQQKIGRPRCRPGVHGGRQDAVLGDVFGGGGGGGGRFVHARVLRMCNGSKRGCDTRRERQRPSRQLARAFPPRARGHALWRRPLGWMLKAAALR